MPKTERITREKIILALLNSSFIKSQGATSLADVAKLLGIKKASLYNHYASRDEMVEDSTKWCGDYMRKTYFIPTDIEAIAQKYPAETVIKGIVNRWFKLNEKEPLLQIYSFIESQKYFSTQASQISAENKAKLISQTVVVLKNLSDAQKISEIDDAKSLKYAELIVSSIQNILDEYLVKRKIEIRSNPESGEGALFETHFEQDFSQLDSIVETFCQLLK